MDWLAYFPPGRGFSQPTLIPNLVWAVTGGLVVWLLASPASAGAAARLRARSLAVAAGLALYLALEHEFCVVSRALLLDLGFLLGCLALLLGLGALLVALGRFLHASEAAAYVPRLRRPRLPG